MIGIGSLFSEHGTGVWAPGRLGAGASASEILGVGQLSNVNAITGTHYFYQSNFNFKHHHFHPEIIYLLRFVCIYPAPISVKEGLFSPKQHTLRNTSLQPRVNPASISVPLRFFHSSRLYQHSIEAAGAQTAGAQKSRTLVVFGRRSKILGIRQSSNVTAISGKLYFHPSNFYFTQHNFEPQKIYLIRIC